MRNKKAWIRVVEAFVAILIITSVVLITIVRVPKTDRSEEIHEMQRLILKQVALNESLREEILDDEILNKVKTKNFIGTMVPINWEFKIKVCKIDEICKTDIADENIRKEIYANELLISSSLNEYNPKKLKLFVWIK